MRSIPSPYRTIPPIRRKLNIVISQYTQQQKLDKCFRESSSFLELELGTGSQTGARTGW